MLTIDANINTQKVCVNFNGQEEVFTNGSDALNSKLVDAAFDDDKEDGTIKIMLTKKDATFIFIVEEEDGNGVCRFTINQAPLVRVNTTKDIDILLGFLVQDIRSIGEQMAATSN